LGDALHSESAEFRVFVADLPGGLEIRGSTPSLNRLEAVELIYGDARSRRRPFEHNDILPGGDAAPACRLDRRRTTGRYSFWNASKSEMSVSVTT
jgi:hypothetical protein